MNTDDFIGMGKRRAQNEAESRNLIFRLVSVDGEKVLGYPDDTGRSDRVCVEITADKVSKATIC